MPETRTRRFQAFGVGIPKSGTTSIWTVFDNYRAGKLASRTQKQLICDFKDGRVTADEVRALVLRRNAESWLEMDATSGNWMFVDHLIHEFPAAKFILTIRDCYSWCDSALNVLIGRDTGNDFTENEHLFRKLFDCEMELFRDPERVVRSAETLVGKLLGFWANQVRVAEKCPASRTLVVRTNEISSSLPAMAEFIGVAVETLLPEQSHSRRTKAKFNVLQKIDRGLLERVFAAHADTAFMKEHFPAATLAGFLDSCETGPTETAVEPPAPPKAPGQP